MQTMYSVVFSMRELTSQIFMMAILGPVGRLRPAGDCADDHFSSAPWCADCFNLEAVI